MTLFPLDMLSAYLHLPRMILFVFDLLFSSCLPQDLDKLDIYKAFVFVITLKFKIKSLYFQIIPSISQKTTETKTLHLDKCPDCNVFVSVGSGVFLVTPLCPIEAPGGVPVGSLLGYLL